MACSFRSIRRNSTITAPRRMTSSATEIPTIPPLIPVLSRGSWGGIPGSRMVTVMFRTATSPWLSVTVSTTVWTPLRWNRWKTCGPGRVVFSTNHRYSVMTPSWSWDLRASNRMGSPASPMRVTAVSITGGRFSITTSIPKVAEIPRESVTVRLTRSTPDRAKECSTSLPSRVLPPTAQR